MRVWIGFSNYNTFKVFLFWKNSTSKIKNTLIISIKNTQMISGDWGSNIVAIQIYHNDIHILI